MMLRKLIGRICPHCIYDDTPVTDHPAIQSMERTNFRLDRLLSMMTPPTYQDGDESPLPLPPWQPKDRN